MAYEQSSTSGSGFFRNKRGAAIETSVTKSDKGFTTIKFEACFSQFSLGPSARGSVAVSKIKNPIARRNTKEITFEIFLDEDEKSLLTTSKFRVNGEKFDAGKISGIEVTASETEVQKPTDVTVKFELAHHIAESSIIKFEFP